MTSPGGLDADSKNVQIGVFVSTFIYRESRITVSRIDLGERNTLRYELFTMVKKFLMKMRVTLYRYPPGTSRVCLLVR